MRAKSECGRNLCIGENAELSVSETLPTSLYSKFQDLVSFIFIINNNNNNNNNNVYLYSTRIHQTGAQELGINLCIMEDTEISVSETLPNLFINSQSKDL